MATRKLIELTEYHSPDGEVYRFDTQDKFLMSFTGMGMPDMNYITQRGPNQHGASLYDYRLNPRVIQMVHRRNTCSRDAYWDARSDLIDLLRPNRQTSDSFEAGTLRKTLSDGSVRDIDVMIEQGPTFSPRNTSRWDEWGYTETLRFIAHDPTFYNPTEETETWTSGLTITELEFSIEFPISFSDSVFDSSANNITYDGTWLTYPTITVTGPIAGFVIENTTTDEKIQMNYSLAAGDTFTITLEYGNKTVEDASGNNLIGTVTTDSDLSTFHIAPAPEATGGVNAFSLSGVGATDDTQVEMSYYTRYIGI